MKKAVIGILCAAMLLCTVAYGGSAYAATIEETKEDLEVDIEPEPVVLIDTDEYYVEFRGIEEHSNQSWIVDLYVENNTDNEVYLELSRGLVNRCMIGFSNNSKKMTAGSKYISSANFDYIIQVSDLQDYNIESIETLEFEVSIKESFLGDDIESASACIEMKKTVPLKDDAIEDQEDEETENIEGDRIEDLEDEESEDIEDKETGNIEKEKIEDVEDEETKDIEDKETEDIVGEILYDDDDVYVEYRGLYEYSESSLIIDLYIENNGDSDVWISLSDGMVDGYSISFSNSSRTILEDSKYLSIPNFDYIIRTEDLEAYEIEMPESLSFKLSISTSLLGDKIGETDVDVSSTVEVSSYDDAVIDEIMERFVDAWLTTPPTVSSSELNGIITYLVTTSDNSSFYIAYSQDADGTNIIKIAPVDLDETTGASDWMVVVGYMVCAVDEDITQSYEGMAVFSEVLDKGDMTKNGIYYYITDDNNYFTIEF